MQPMQPVLNEIVNVEEHLVRSAFIAVFVIIVTCPCDGSLCMIVVIRSFSV